MTEPEKVYSRDELIEMLADFIDALSDDEKTSLAPETMGIVENVSNGINQAFDRIDRMNESLDKMQVANEGFKARISEYAADQSDRMRNSAKKEEDENPAQELIEATLEDGE